MQFLIDLDNVCTIKNKSKYSIKLVQTTLPRPDYVSTLPDRTKNSTKITRPLNAVHSFEQIVPSFYRKSFNVPLFHCFLENSLAVFWQKIFRFSLVFFKIILKFNMVNFNMSTKVKLSWLATCHSYDVIKLLSIWIIHIILEYLFLFPLV